jgi:hypothetical protein
VDRAENTVRDSPKKGILSVAVPQKRMDGFPRDVSNRRHGFTDLVRVIVGLTLERSFSFSNFDS